MKIGKDKIPDLLSQDSADQMLQNIFEACDVEPNTVPLEDLESYSNYRRDKFTIQKVAIAIIIVIFLLIPCFFVAPVLSLTPIKSDDNGVLYSLSVNTLIPITNVSADINGKKVPVYQTDEGIYSVEPDENGELTVTVNLLNKQYDTVKAEVTAVDADYDTPVLGKYENKNGMLTLNISDKKSGINYNAIYAEDSNGHKMTPEIIKKEKNKGTIAFAYQNDSLNIFLPDNAGNTLQLVLTVK